MGKLGLKIIKKMEKKEDVQVASQSSYAKYFVVNYFLIKALIMPFDFCVTSCFAFFLIEAFSALLDEDELLDEVELLEEEELLKEAGTVD